MTEREALKKLLLESDPIHERDLDDDWGDGEIEEIADHLLSNGVIVPPVKIGQTVYPLYADPRFRAFVEKIEQTTNGFYFEWVQYDVGVDCTECWDAEGFDIGDIGKTVFLDETEYLIALKEREKQK